MPGHGRDPNRRLAVIDIRVYHIVKTLYCNHVERAIWNGRRPKVVNRSGESTCTVNLVYRDYLIVGILGIPWCAFVWKIQLSLNYPTIGACTLKIDLM